MLENENPEGERGDRETDRPDPPPAKHSTDDDDKDTPREDDAKVEEASRESMNGSDAPAW